MSKFFRKSRKKSLHNVPIEENASEQVPEKLENTGKLVLSSEGIQIVNINTSSTTMLRFGMEMVDVTRIFGNVLDSQIPEPQINSQCGAGPMTMIWNNVLNLMFQKDRSSSSENLDVVGWNVNYQNDQVSPTTMAGLGIGSTRADLLAAYNAEVTNNTLGYEFTTIPPGLFGILSGPSPTDTIGFMWRFEL